jgi:hypothetical protein
MQGDRTRQDGRGRSSDELWAGLVAEIAVMPDVVANLLREHQPDEQGFCTGNGCGTAGRGVPTTRWPCALHTLALEAEGARAAASTDRKPSRPTDTETRRAPASEERAEAPAIEEEPATRDDRPPISTAAAWLIRRR